jgi:hypothetical protein
MRTILTLAAFALLVALLGYTIVPRLPQTAPAAATQTPAWNPTAIQSKLASVEVREIDPAHAALVFSYDLENTTDADYQLPKGPSTIIMTRLKADGTLSSGEPIELNNSIFLPARNRTRISFQINRLFRWPTELVPGRMGPLTQDKYRSLVSQEVGNLSGFVLFDQAAHYQIELPGRWQELQAPSANPAVVN